MTSLIPVTVADDVVETGRKLRERETFRENVKRSASSALVCSAEEHRDAWTVTQLASSVTQRAGDINRFISVTDELWHSLNVYAQVSRNCLQLP